MIRAQHTEPYCDELHAASAIWFTAYAHLDNGTNGLYKKERSTYPHIAMSNPLTKRTSQIPFNAFSAEQVAPAIDVLLEEASSELEEIKALTGLRTFDNTIRALDDLGLNLDYAMSVISHLESVATTPAWRFAYNEVLPKVSDFRSKLMLDAGLWNALSAYAATPDAENLPAHQKRFLVTTLDSFRRSGAELSDDKKAILAEINRELATITNSFSQNTLDATNAFEYTTTSLNDLRGLPESAITMGRASAAAKKIEGWRYTLQAPSYMAIMTYADSAALREKFYHAYNTRCAGDTFDNTENLYRILELRRQKANLLGFADFSDLVLADRMAKRGETAQRFVDDLCARIRAAFERDKTELETFFATTTGQPATTLQPWDVPYYAEKMRKANYDFDEEELRPYFELSRVMNGLFTFVEKVFGLTVTPNPSLPTWDPHVQAYSTFDSQSGELIGYFYADLYPRENKRGGAWMNNLVMHVPADGKDRPHVGLIAGNFTPPSEAGISLITHDEVTTLFHEFGHLMHQLCNTTELRGQSMSGVAWDFIELPSQILENWCWDRESLNMIAAHYETGSPIPDDLFSKMLKARNYRSASHLMRQLGFSTVDFALHRSYLRERDGEILGYTRTVLNPFSSIPLPPDFSMIATFTHLFSSPVAYAAGYYSYQWAEVLDADAFSRFERDGLLNRATGLDFRDKVLSRGDSADPAALFESFMGRGPDTSALLKRSGLLAA
jgi:oligopeptidase A